MPDDIKVEDLISGDILGELFPDDAPHFPEDNGEREPLIVLKLAVAFHLLDVLKELLRN